MAARGSVIKRGSTFSVVLDLGRDENGKRIRKWHSGYSDRDEAERARTELLRALDTQTYVAPSKVTLRQFAEERWLPALDALVPTGKPKASTVQNYRVLLNAYVLPKLGRVQLRELTTDQLVRLYGSLLTSGRRRGKDKTALSSTTVHHVHIAIHRLLRDAQDWGLVSRNVADQARRYAPKPAKRDMTERLWSPAQLSTFLESQTGTRHYALWLLFTTTGLRRGEACGLRWPEIDLDSARLTIRRSRVVVNHKVVDTTVKTDHSEATIALDAWTTKALRAHRAQQASERLAWGPAHQGTDLVFTWEDGAPLHPDLVTRTLKRLAAKAGLPVLTPHGLRHSYATAALEAGVPMKVVSERLRHSSMSVTADLYTHVREEVDQQAAERVAALIFGTGT